MGEFLAKMWISAQVCISYLPLKIHLPDSHWNFSNGSNFASFYNPPNVVVDYWNVF